MLIADRLLELQVVRTEPEAARVVGHVAHHRLERRDVGVLQGANGDSRVGVERAGRNLQRDAAELDRAALRRDDLPERSARVFDQRPRAALDDGRARHQRPIGADVDGHLTAYFVTVRKADAQRDRPGLAARRFVDHHGEGAVRRDTRADRLFAHEQRSLGLTRLERRHEAAHVRLVVHTFAVKRVCDREPITLSHWQRAGHEPHLVQ